MRNNIILKDIINLDLKKNFFLYGIDKLINQKVFKLPNYQNPRTHQKEPEENLLSLSVLI